MTAQDTYQKLTKLVREAALLGSVGSTLGWDQETYMPHNAAAHRSEQSSLLARLAHEGFTSPKIGELLGEVEASDFAKGDSDEAVNIRELRRDYDRATKLPGEFVEEMSRTTVMAHHGWVDARKKSDFKVFEPWLVKVLDLKKREAGYVGYETCVYDALLDPFEPGMTAAEVTRIFDGLRPRLVELIHKVTESTKKAPVEIIERSYPVAAQEKLAREAATAVGFDWEAGRLDTSVHPFCTGLGPGDTRMTARYAGRRFNDGLFGVLHETGHCLYEQGLPKQKYFGLPMGDAASLGIHESQSRLWENLVGRSRSFWKYFLPKAKAAFPDALKDVSEDQWYFAINDVRPSLIRVEADEATYNLHIMLRFTIEQAMLEGDITVADVPATWNEMMKKDLGVDVPDDAKGCLQDTHWSGGAIGYFPTYALGNLYAAQFFEQARKDLGDLDAQFAAGEFQPLLGWLRTNIHQHARRYRASELVQRVTGQPLSPEPLLRHLSSKASELYGV